jgi:hypothetical protein
MSYPSAAAERKAVGDYIIGHAFLDKMEIFRRIQEAGMRMPDPDFGLYLVNCLIGNPKVPVPKDLKKDFNESNYLAIKAIYESNLDPAITREKGALIAANGEAREKGYGLQEMRAMHYVLTDYCFPGMNATLRSNVRARLNSLWDGICGWSS